MAPIVSVVMPVFEQEAFVRRAIGSLVAQSLRDWELVIVDDGSQDGTAAAVERHLYDPRVTLLRLEENYGLGVALNVGLERARAAIAAYLPADDVVYADHLSSLVERLRDENAIAAYAGVRHHYNRIAEGAIDGSYLQLVQVAHRVTDDRWLERAELVTDDLERMFWSKLRARGEFLPTGRVTCEWVEHPRQRSKVIAEPQNGLNTYRSRYRVKDPIRFHPTFGGPLDEVAHYRRLRERPDTPPAADGLTILLVGELAYNAERVLALEERGHRLYGLWMPDPMWFNAVGPVPFGHVTDVPRTGWREAVERLRPDVIYALLNWQAVPFAHHVLEENPGVPFVWHFKEGPFISIEKGNWRELVELYSRADGAVYSSPEVEEWFRTVLPEEERLELVLDGDLPKREWFAAERSRRLSDEDGELHTVVPGRPIGLHPPNVVELADQRIHLHFYGEFMHGLWREWIETVARKAPGYLHLHATVNQDRWVTEFSRYDAGWLHVFASKNGGEIRRADWDDLNYPARIPTLVSAGLPLLQRDNSGSVVAAQSLVRERDLGLFFTSFAEVGPQLREEGRMAELREAVWAQRDEFTFDHHVDRLVAFFRDVCERAART
ncbi:MAG: glycosyltransferase [Actinomycetota bacterium]|nr:glycosyltransferase [Actinomycetota bacterium]